MRARPRLLLAAALLLPVLAAAPAQAQSTAPSPAPADSVTWAVEPAGPDGPDGRVSLRHTLAPGDTADDRVLLTNYSAVNAAFRVYASDGIVTDGGSFDLPPSVTAPTDGGSWVRVGPVDGATDVDGLTVVEVAAGASVAVPVSIVVPADATPGDHPAGVVAELETAPGSTVDVATRVGVRLHLRVSGALEPRLDAGSVHASWQPSWNPFAPGTVLLTYTIENLGNVRLGAEATAAVAGPGGVSSASDSVSRREVLPRQQVRVESRLTSWPVFLSRGKVTVTPGIVGTDDVDAALSAGTAPFTVWTLPWSQLALVALVLAGIWLVRRVRRASSARVQQRIDAAVVAALADDATRAGEQPVSS